MACMTRITSLISGAKVACSRRQSNKMLRAHVARETRCCVLTSPEKQITEAACECSASCDTWQLFRQLFSLCVSACVKEEEEEEFCLILISLTGCEN